MGLTLLILCLAARAFAAGDAGFAATINAYLDGASQKPELVSAGLPAEIEASIKEAGDYLDYPESETPIYGEGITLDGRPAGDKDMAQILSDDHGIHLPAGTRIARLSPGTKKELWVFPTGARLIHRFFQKTVPPRLTELRLSERRADGRWASGVYVPEKNGRLRLLTAKKSVALTVSWKGGTALLSMRRLEPESCRMCHYGESDNDYPDERTAGPCGFGPANPKLLTAWAEAFKAAKGYSPFVR